MEISDDPSVLSLKSLELIVTIPWLPWYALPGYLDNKEAMRESDLV